jgi:uncharacterized membrane protein YccC
MSTGTDEARQTAVAVGLRSSTAAAVCLVLSESLHLDMAYLSVYTAHLINLQYAHTPFQKGIERIIGRLLGIFAAVVVVVLLHAAPLLCLAVTGALLVPVFYVQASDRFKYGATMAAVFMAAAVGNNLAGNMPDPGAYLRATAVQLLLGVAVSDVLNILAGAETTLSIDPGHDVLLPVRPDWLNRGLRLSVSVLATGMLALRLGLPALTSMVSAVILGTTADPRALQEKSLLRAAAAALGGVYGLVALWILALLPDLALMVLLLFLALFCGSYLAQTSTAYGYIGMQMGLVVPMVLVVPAYEVADLGKATQRLLCVVFGGFVALVFQILWPQVAAPPPSPLSPEERGSEPRP